MADYEDDFKCLHCRFFDIRIRHCNYWERGCVYDTDDEPEDEIDVIPLYDDVLPVECSCGGHPRVMCSGGMYYWVTCDICKRTTSPYTDTLDSFDSGRTRAIKEWNRFNGGGP